MGTLSLTSWEILKITFVSWLRLSRRVRRIYDMYVQLKVAFIIITIKVHIGVIAVTLCHAFNRVAEWWPGAIFA